MFIRIFLLIIFYSATYISSQTPDQILNKIKSYQQSETLKHSQFSVSAKFVESGESIISYNGETSIIPASNLKLLTTAAVLEILGEDYTYETKLFYDGEIDKAGTLNGNIILYGGGDPILGSENFEERPDLNSVINLFVKSISQKGIKKINGSVIVDNSRYDHVTIPDKWYWEDIGNYYGSQTSALTINDNLYKIYFKPGSKVGETANFLRTEPEIPNLEFINNMKTGEHGSGDNGYVFNSPQSFKAEFRGTIPMGYNEFSIKGSIPDPALFAAQILDKKLNESGIKTAQLPKVINEKSIKYDESKKLLTIVSPTLKEIINFINKKSFNLYAEMILKEIGFKVFGEGSFEKGIEAELEFLKEKGIDTDGLEIYDGSGLSHSNIITTDIVTELLVKMKNSKSFDTYLNSLAVAGDYNDLGTLKSFGKGTVLEKNVFAKTGTLGGVRAHSGYLKTVSGKLIAFSIITNYYSGGSWGVYNIHKNILLELAGIK